MPEEAPTRSSLRRARQAVLRWYDGQRRELPWRGSRDPWAILVSEVMCQQTTVAAVTPYWEGFMHRWPTAAALAAAPGDALLSQWAGLGYYRRAHLLQRAARELARAPCHDAAGLARLPGVGPYTAAAVASIAFGEAVAAVDGNVERVVSRLAALPGDPTKAAGRRAVRRVAEALLDSRRPGDFNQAVMDLGATVCRPRDPHCARCPLASCCVAHARGEEHLFPRLPPRSASTPLQRVAALVTARGKVLVQLRDAAPNQGFLELPAVDIPSDTAHDEPRIDALRDAFARQHDLDLRVGPALPMHRHSITRYRIALHPFRASLASGRVRAPLSWAGATPDKPFTTATRRVLAASLPQLFRSTS